MNNSKPHFSVCIPTYNRANMLPAAIDSILAQDFIDYELIIVDNASTDNTLEIVSRYTDTRIKLHRNDSTVSMYANHNLCVKYARSDWVVFLHSDDRLENSALSILRNRIESQQCEVVYPAKTLHQDYVKNGDLLLTGSKSLPSLLRWPAGTPSGAAYKKSLINEIEFDDSLIVSDLILLADTLRHGCSILICTDDTVKIGEGEFQFSSKWHQSGAFITDVAKAFKKFINYPGVLHDLELEIPTWSDSEIAFLLMMLSHANERQAIDRLQKILIKNTSYKKNPNYRHVFLYKLLGIQCMQTAFRATKYLRNM
jgi:glycosyltransferase involved in cell wall biosynthesis